MGAIAKANSPCPPAQSTLHPCCFNGQRIHHHGQTSPQSPRLAMASVPTEPSAPNQPGVAPDCRAAVYRRFSADRVRRVQP